eukprot:scaffold127553_cov25-Prasinocladus_malaysianus.AAC.1
MDAGGIRSVSFSAVMPDHGAKEPPIEEETVQFQVPQFVIGTDQAKVSCRGQTKCIDLGVRVECIVGGLNGAGSRRLLQMMDNVMPAGNRYCGGVLYVAMNCGDIPNNAQPVKCTDRCKEVKSAGSMMNTDCVFGTVSAQTNRHERNSCLASTEEIRICWPLAIDLAGGAVTLLADMPCGVAVIRGPKHSVPQRYTPGRM